MLKIDQEFKSLIPALSKEEFEQLEKNCISEGIRERIVLWDMGYELCTDGVHLHEISHDEPFDTCMWCDAKLETLEMNWIIIDGHNRYEIAQKHDLKYDITFKHFDSREEVIDWMINNQLGRRNLTKETQSYLRGLQYKREKKKITNPYGVKGKDEPQNDEHLSTSQKLAEQHKVSKATIERDEKFAEAVDTIVENTAPEVKQKILNKEINTTKKDIEKIAKLEPEKQKAIIEKIISGEAKSAIDAKRLVKKDEVHETPVIEGKYRIIYADPPWKYNDKRDGNTTGAEDHYPTMSIEEICELPIKELAEDNAVLFLWTTSPLLEDTFKVISAWGFKYKSSFIWDKVKHNMGHYNSVRHELLLICTRGSCTPDNVKLFDSVQSIERTDKHSEKPEEFREIIDTLYTYGNKIELFSRKKVEGWKVWGNQS